LIGIDTNVLVRYFVQDDIEQTRRAVRFLERDCTAESPGLISEVVLTELVWVLESVYRYPRQKISVLIGGILSSDQLTVENSNDARSALPEYQAGADFTDALIAAIYRRLDCKHTVTFDRRAVRRHGFVAL
jgi:predicted nucleic-acid-binding protein